MTRTSTLPFFVRRISRPSAPRRSLPICSIGGTRSQTSRSTPVLILSFRPPFSRRSYPAMGGVARGQSQSHRGIAMPNVPSDKPEPAATCAWERLSVSLKTSLHRGAVLRTPDVGDLMLMEHRDAASGYALVAIAGGEAGAVHLLLPSEAKGEPGPISLPWIKAKWSPWISPSGMLDNALLGSGFIQFPL